MGANLAAIAAPVPPLEPPGVVLRSQGLRVWPNRLLVVLMSAANSGVFDLPIRTAPAAFSRATDNASSVGIRDRKCSVPSVVRKPTVSRLSLATKGTPSRGRSAFPPAT